MNLDNLIETNDKLMKLTVCMSEALHEILGGNNFDITTYKNEHNKDVYELKIYGTDWDFKVSKTTYQICKLIKEGKLSWEYSDELKID